MPDHPSRLLEISLSLCCYLAIPGTQLNILLPFARIRVPAVKKKGNVDTKEVISSVCSAPLSDRCSEYFLTPSYNLLSAQEESEKKSVSVLRAKYYHCLVGSINHITYFDPFLCIPQLSIESSPNNNDLLPGKIQKKGMATNCNSQRLDNLVVRQ